MKVEEFIECITNDGLKRILGGLDLPYSYPRTELVEKVLTATDSKSTRHVLQLLNSKDLIDICRAHKLPVTGNNSKLIDQIVSHRVKVVTKDGLIYDVKRWKPEKRYQSEQGYTDNLEKYLIEKGYDIKTNFGRTKPDLLINDRFPIEMKYVFGGKADQNRATGQLNDYIREFGYVILLVCDYYADREDFDEEIDRLLSPDMKGKCLAIYKRWCDDWQAYTAKSPKV